MTPSPLSLNVLSVLRRAIQRLCPRYLRQEVEDLEQVAMVRALETSRRRGDGIAWTKAYVYCLARSVIVDRMRRQSRRPTELSKEEAGVDATELAAVEWTANPEYLAYRQSMREVLMECIDRIKADRRSAVVLVAIQGHSIAEAAQMLGWSNRKVENCLYRGRKDLRRLCAARNMQIG